MEKVIITGGAGFIGSHLAEELVSKGHEVTVVDNLFDGKRENLDGVKDKIHFIEGDIRDKKLMNELCSNADHILHQAARRSVPASLKDPFEYNDVNINGTLNILEAARRNDIKSVVFASSSSVYGEVKEENLPQKETMTPGPMSPYALTKVAGEHYLSMYNKLYGLKTISLRYFNVFGPRQDPNSQYAVVIPLFVKALMEGKQPVIYGDGEQSRDFTYIKNVVNGNILAMNAKEKAGGEVFNMANGHAVSVNDLLDRIKRILGGKAMEIEAKHEGPRAGDVRHTLADNSKAKDILGYEEEVGFDDGLRTTVEWFRENLKNPE
ncbi:MAG: SDR family oxidoreductase [Candidatus Woesearchaeota archaeon]